MQLAILAAVLAALAKAESSGPVPGLGWRLAVVAVAILIAPLAALLGTQRLAPAVAANADRDDAISRLHTLVICLWLGAVAAVLFVAQWPQIVRSNWQLGDLPLIDELAILLPVVAPLLLVWAALYGLDRAAQAAAYRTRQLALPPPDLGRYLWLQVRQHLGLVLAPPLAIVSVFETLEKFDIAAGEIDSAWWLVIPLAAIMLFLMPLAVRRIWRTSPLAAGPLRDMLTAICITRRCRIREMLIWHTDSTMANAAVVGFSQWLRYVLLTDLLVKRLNDAEIAAVVRHELAHLRRWHLPLRLALLVLPVVLWLAIRGAWPSGETILAAQLAAYGIGMKAAASFAVPVGMLVYAVVVVGWYSRLLEHDADLDACLSDCGRFEPSAADDFCRALITLYGRSRENWLGEWLHPTLRQRLTFVQSAASEPSLIATFRRKLALIAGVMAVEYVVAAVLAVL
jgi:Zn-dependent protease with chaperone function